MQEFGQNTSLNSNLGFHGISFLGVQMPFGITESGFYIVNNFSHTG